MNSMELMARRERGRLKDSILRAARAVGYFSGTYGVRAVFNFAPEKELDLLFNGYTGAECGEIVREVTLEIIDELMDGLASTKKRIQSGGET